MFEQRQESWDIPPHERAISEVHFKKLDEDNDGFIDKEDFGRFISIYKISSPDLDRVWYVSLHIVAKHDPGSLQVPD